jgi:transmembrane sensor
MPLNNHIADLIIKHLQDTITTDETQVLEQWIAADEKNRVLYDQLTNSDWVREQLVAHVESEQRIKEQVYAQLPEVQDALNVTPKRLWMRYASIAAAVLVIIAGSIWYLMPKQSATTDVPQQQIPVAATIPAGGNKATLTLADGTVIDLDKAGLGTIAKEGKTTVNKKEDGQLEYKSVIGNRQSAITYNLLSTPRGGQYQLLLPDGSKVWLNAASSIRYPTAFAGNDRRVEVTGEVYFEVATDTKKPFKVTILPPPAGGGSRGGEVEVLGTHFNINAYGDENDAQIKVTLLEGSVKIKPEGEGLKLKKNLKPGQQAIVGERKIDIINDVDVWQVVAWKNGKFVFTNSNIQLIMRQIERWYDVNVEYEGIISDERYNGEFYRDARLSEVLMLLKASDVHFVLKGRTLIVKP